MRLGVLNYGRRDYGNGTKDRVTVNISTLINELDRLPVHRVFGRVSAVQGLLVEVSGVQGNLSVGDRCNVIARDERKVTCEVVGFREGRALLMPFGALEGIEPGLPRRNR